MLGGAVSRAAEHDEYARHAYLYLFLVAHGRRLLSNYIRNFFLSLSRSLRVFFIFLLNIYDRCFVYGGCGVRRCRL